MNINDRLSATAQERGLRQSTVYSYRRLLNMLGIEDDSLSFEEVQERLLAVDNINTRRAASVAVRAVLGHKVRIPRGAPRRYDLPDEDTLRLALMQSPHEVRGLLMMYAGLRNGEACAVTRKQLSGDRLTVDRQVVELHASARQTGGDSQKVLRLGPVKTNEGAIIVPHFLCPMIDTLTETTVPSQVRESLRRAGHKVGISLNPHLLRKWYCTTLLSKGAPLELVRQQMRHSNISITLTHYQQFSQGDIHGYFER